MNKQTCQERPSFLKVGANTAPTVLDILLNDPGNDAYSYLTLFINVRDDKGYVIFFTYGSIIVAGMCNRIDAEGEPDEDRSFMDVLYRPGIFALHLAFLHIFFAGIAFHTFDICFDGNLFGIFCLHIEDADQDMLSYMETLSGISRSVKG